MNKYVVFEWRAVMITLPWVIQDDHLRVVARARTRTLARTIARVLNEEGS